jgi:hypothetical protein
MNRRILKKRCKRAMEVLIAEHRFPRAAFHPATGDETVAAPAGIDPRFDWHGFLEPGPLKGTPLYWAKDPMSQDADAHLPSVMLEDVIFWSFFVYREDEPMPRFTRRMGDMVIVDDPDPAKPPTEAERAAVRHWYTAPMP